MQLILLSFLLPTILNNLLFINENFFFSTKIIFIVFFILRNSIPEVQKLFNLFLLKIKIFHIHKQSDMLYRVKFVMICDE